MLERRPFRVVGVMPASFAMPAPDVQVFLPWGLAGDEPRDQHYLSAVARLAPGATLPQAEEELRAVAREPRRGASPDERGLERRASCPCRKTSWATPAAPSLCSSAAVGARAPRGLRQRGPPVPRARARARARGLGPPRPRRVAAASPPPVPDGAGPPLSRRRGCWARVFAVAGLALLKRADAGLPRVHEVALDPRALLFAGVATAAAALISGLPSAWRRARAEPAPDLVGTPAPGRRRPRPPRLPRRTRRRRSRDGGGAPRGSEPPRAQLPGAAGRRPRVRSAAACSSRRSSSTWRATGAAGRAARTTPTLIERLEALPGVVSAGGATALPASPLGPDFERPVWPEENPGDERTRRPAWVRVVTTDYFRTLGMRVVAGRVVRRARRPATARSPSC